MAAAALLAGRPRLTVGLALLLSAAGVAAWTTMPRQEDPRLPDRFGMVVATYPGADAEQVERLVVDPLEEALAEVDEIRHVDTTMRSGVAVISVQLRDDVYDTDQAWGRVKDALERARPDLPAEASPPVLDDRLLDTEAAVFALTGSEDPLVLADAARALERRLLRLSTVSRVVMTGDPGEQVTVMYDDATARRLGVDPLRLAAEIGRRSVTTPGGSLRLGGRTVDLRPEADFRTVEELADLPLALPGGGLVRLGEVATVRRMPAEPLATRARLDGRTAVAVGVVARRDADATAFGEAVRATAEAFRADHPHLGLAELAFQPDKVEARLSELGGSLLLGVGIVAAVLFVAMGLRLGLVVAAIVPLVTFASVALFAAGGGVLHQISVAALVMALGLLVDNAIVMAETVQRHLDDGLPRGEAVRTAVRELAAPLGSATGTTLAAFLPMLLSEGVSADFTRTIPVVLMITLSASYLYALFVTPVLSGAILRPGRAPEGGSALDRLAAAVGAFSARRPAAVLAGTAGLLALGVLAARAVTFDFFPSSDREQLVVQVELSEGSHLDATDAASRRVEAALSRHPDVVSVAAFVGRSAPRFYYNLPDAPRSPHLAQLVVTTGGSAAVPRVQAAVRDLAARALPEAQVTARKLEQGPPVAAPLQVRLCGDDLDALTEAARAVRDLLLEVPGARAVRTDQGGGVPTLRFAVDDATAARRGLARADVALALLGRTRGLPVGTFRGGDDPVPIVLRASAGEDLPPPELAAIDVALAGMQPVPVGELAASTVEWKPAVLHHRDRVRVVSVLADVEDGLTWSTVLDRLAPRLAALDLPPGVERQIAGAAESSGEANASLAARMPLAMLVLLGLLLWEFDSFRRVAIVLATAPLAALGAFPGLLLADLPFGFVALLGVLALIGIVVNGAIVLIDLADRRRAEGDDARTAVAFAVRLRTRPILLTTATTVAGLTPLLFSHSTLWPPMAAGMISGLLISTLLTLFVVPALYAVLCARERRFEPTPEASPATA